MSSLRIVRPNFPFVLNHSNFRSWFLFLFSVIYSGSTHDIFPLLCHLCHDHKFSEACSSMCTRSRLGFGFQILHLVWNTTWFWQKGHIQLGDPCGSLKLSACIILLSCPACVCAGNTVAGVFYNVKNGSSFFTSKSS